MMPLPVLTSTSIDEHAFSGSDDTWHEKSMADRPRVLLDGCGRRIDHLRLSVTSVCNLRCVYCRPAGEAGTIRRASLLSDSQRIELVELFRRRYALEQLRITGGEPLLHPTLVSLVAAVRTAAPHLAIALTTNGQRLSNTARDLRDAGLDRLNISLDTLDPAQYRRLTGGELHPVLKGIEAALSAGFPAPKINTVVLNGFNDRELPDLTRWAIRHHCEIRFLEAMPIGPAAEFNRRHFVSASRIQRTLAGAFHLAPLPRGPGETAARFLAVGHGGSGVVGIIAPLSQSFCGQCRRVRITADGRLYPCLLDPRSVDLLPAWREDVFSASAADQLVRLAVAGKKPRGSMGQTAPMISLGG